MERSECKSVMSREEAIQKLIDHDVSKWGEEEREPSRCLRGGLSHGLALNAVAMLDPCNPDRDLMRQARELMTPADRRVIRNGG